MSLKSMNPLGKALATAAIYADDGADKTAIEIAFKAFFGDELAPSFDHVKWVIGAVIAERARQVRTLGYDEAHDDDHDKGELATAAVMFALPPAIASLPVMNEALMDSPLLADLLMPSTFDVLPQCGQLDMSRASLDDVHKRLSDLAKAGALILAEMQRLLRTKTIIEAVEGAR